MADSKKNGKPKSGSGAAPGKDARSRTIELTAEDVTPASETAKKDETAKAEAPKDAAKSGGAARAEAAAPKDAKTPETKAAPAGGGSVLGYAAAGLFGGVAALLGAAVLVSFQMIDLSGNAGKQAQDSIGALDKKLSTALDAASGRGEKRDAAIAALEKSVEKAVSRSSVHEDMIGKSSAALTGVQSGLKKTGGEVSVVADRLGRLTASLSAAEKRIESLNGSLGALDARLKAEAEARAALGPRITANAGMLEKRGSDIAKMMKWQDAAAAESRKLASQMAGLLAGLKDIERSVADASAAGGGEPSSAGVRLALVDRKIARVEKDMAGLSTTLKNLPAVPPDLSPQIAVLEKTVARFDKNFAESGKRHAAVQDLVRKLDERVRDLALLGGRMNALNTRIDEVKARYGALGEAMTTLRSASQALGLGEDGNSKALAGLESQIAALKTELAGKIAALEKTTAGITEAESKLAGVDVRLESVKTTQAALAAMQKRAATEQAAARLSRDLLSGIAYSDALAGFVALAPAVQVPDAVKALAPSGVPSMAKLRADFAALKDAIDAAAVMKPDDGLMGKLMKSAGSVVSIRRTGPAAGTSPSAVASRIADYLAKGKLAAAINEAGSMGGDMAGKVQGWAKGAKARLAAEKFAADVMALAMAGPEQG